MPPAWLRRRRPTAAPWPSRSGHGLRRFPMRPDGTIRISSAHRSRHLPAPLQRTPKSITARLSGALWHRSHRTTPMALLRRIRSCPVPSQSALPPARHRAGPPGHIRISACGRDHEADLIEKTRIGYISMSREHTVYAERGVLCRIKYEDIRIKCSIRSNLCSIGTYWPG